LTNTMQTNDSAWNGDTRQIQVFQETAMPCRHLFNVTTHEDRSTGILPNVPNDDDDDDDDDYDTYCEPVS